MTQEEYDIMSKIKNTPTITDDPIINLRRSDIEQRAEWFYFMNDEAGKRGIDWEEYCRPAIHRVGCFRGAESFEGIDRSDLIAVANVFKNNTVGSRTFEKEYVKLSEDEVIIDHHYCPLLAAWQKLTDDEELIAKCCDIAMEGDRGIFSLVEGATFHLDSTLAEGAPVRIGTVEYPTLDEAVAAAEDGDVIELLADCTSSGMNLSKNLTIRGVEGTPRRITFTGAGIALWGKSLTFETCAVDMTGVGKTPYAEWSWMTICASKNAELSLRSLGILVTVKEEVLSL